MASMKCVGPTMRTRRRSTPTTPGTARIAAMAFSAAPAGAPGERGVGLFRPPLRRRVERRFDGGAAEPQAEDRYHHGNRDGGGRVTPGKAEPGQHEAGDGGDGGERG